MTGGPPRRNVPERGAAGSPPIPPRTIRGPRRALCFVAVGGLLALGRVVLAGETDLHGVTGFDEFSENHANIGKALSQRPSLALDPDYLKHHPSLAQFLKDNPLSRAELESKGEEDDTQDNEIDPSEGRHPEIAKKVGRFPRRIDSSDDSTPPPRRSMSSSENDE